MASTKQILTSDFKSAEQLFDEYFFKFVESYTMDEEIDIERVAELAYRDTMYILNKRNEYLNNNNKKGIFN